MIIHTLAVIFAIQLLIYLGLNLWIWRSYLAIPKRMMEHSESALLRMSDTNLFVQFIRWCGFHHMAHAPIMVIIKAAMIPHMLMDIKIMVLCIIGWAILIAFDLKTALISHKARCELKLD